MNEKLAQALDHIDGKYIAAAAKRKKKPYRLAVAIAAILALGFMGSMVQSNSIAGTMNTAFGSTMFLPVF